ncbi:HEAT repeat domain-containing protein [Candidatus Riflebacteria bacterium]
MIGFYITSIILLLILIYIKRKSFFSLFKSVPSNQEIFSRIKSHMVKGNIENETVDSNIVSLKKGRLKRSKSKKEEKKRYKFPSIRPKATAQQEDNSAKLIDLILKKKERNITQEKSADNIYSVHKIESESGFWEGAGYESLLADRQKIINSVIMNSLPQRKNAIFHNPEERIQNDPLLSALFQVLDCRTPVEVLLEKIKYLASHKSEDSVEVIAELLYHADGEVRWQANEALEKINTAESLDALVNYSLELDKKILDFSNDKLRVSQKAKNNEKEVRHKHTVPETISLIELAKKFPSIRVIDNFPNPDPEFLNQALADTQDREKTELALRVIGEKKLSDFSESLVHLLQTEMDYRLQFFAAQSLGKMKNRSGISVLLNSLVHEEEYFRYAAANALSQVAGPEHIDKIIPILEDPVPAIRAAAAKLLGFIKDDFALDALKKALLKEKEDDSILRNVCAAIVKISSKRSSYILLDALDHAIEVNDKDFKLLLLEFIRQIQDSRLAEQLQNILSKEKDPDILFELSQVLLENGDNQDFDALFQASRRLDKAVMECAGKLSVPVDIDSFQDMHKRDPVDRLILRSKSSSSMVRACSVILLAKYGKKEELQPLVEILNDKSAYVRSCTVFALGNLGIKEAGAYILPLLTDADEEVRYQACRVLGKLRFKDARERLKKISEDDQCPDVKQAAIKALKETA